MITWTKKCNKCKEAKTFDNFHRSKTGTFGLHPVCKSCKKLGNKNKIPLGARAAEIKYAAANQHKRKAKEAVRQAIKTGRLFKLPCEHCGETKKIQGHHPDYSQPLLVIWLCPPCHSKEHSRLKKLTTLVIG